MLSQKLLDRFLITPGERVKIERAPDPKVSDEDRARYEKARVELLKE